MERSQRLCLANQKVEEGLRHGRQPLAFAMHDEPLPHNRKVFDIEYDLLVLGNAATVVSVLVVWLLWSWAGAQIWQGFLFGTPHADYVFESAARDVPVFRTVLAALLAVTAIVAAFLWSMTWLMH